MNASKTGTQAPWVDPDEAPEITEEQFAAGVWRIGERVVSRSEAHAYSRRGRPALPEKRPTLNMRIDADVLEALRSSGPGWQTRLNALLREAMQQGRLK